MELTLVILILSLLTVFCVPNVFKIIANHKLKSTANIMVSNIREAQELAVSKETNTMLKFYKNISGTKIDKYSFKLPIDNKYRTYKGVQLPEEISLVDVNFNSSKNICTFNYYGRPTCNGHITLEDNYKKRLYVIIFQTGRVRISNELP